MEGWVGSKQWRACAVETRTLSHPLAPTKTTKREWEQYLLGLAAAERAVVGERVRVLVIVEGEVGDGVAARVDPPAAGIAADPRVLLVLRVGPTHRTRVGLHHGERRG